MTKFWLSIFVALTFVFSAAAQSQPKTVSDFFYLLPETYFVPYSDGNGAKPTLRDYRKSIIKTEDIKNGYLRIEQPTAEGWAEVAIFKKMNGKYIVAVAENGCGPSCSTEIMDFLSYENGNWQAITDQVLPKIPDGSVAEAFKRHKIPKDKQSGLVYKLPRVGTTIDIVTGADDAPEVALFALTWDGAKFTLKNK